MSRSRGYLTSTVKVGPDGEDVQVGEALRSTYIGEGVVQVSHGEDWEKGWHVEVLQSHVETHTCTHK